MKVKELVKKLQALDQNAEVILSSDSEGNRYNKIHGGSICELLYREDDGEFEFCPTDEKEAAEDGQDIKDFKKKAVVIWPYSMNEQEKLQELVDALCIVASGWQTKSEGEIHQKALSLVANRGYKLKVEAEIKRLSEIKQKL